MKPLVTRPVRSPKTEAYAVSCRERKKVEMLFAHLKRILRLGRLRLRGPNGAKDEFLLAATAQNLRKLAKLIPHPGADLRHIRRRGSGISLADPSPHIPYRARARRGGSSTKSTLSGHTRSALSDASGLCEAKTLIDKKALQARRRRACQRNWQRGRYGGQRAGCDLLARSFKCWWKLETFSTPAGIAERLARLPRSGDCGSATIRSGRPGCSRQVACRTRRERERHREHA